MNTWDRVLLNNPQKLDPHALTTFGFIGSTCTGGGLPIVVFNDCPGPICILLVASSLTHSSYAEKDVKGLVYFRAQQFILQHDPYHYEW